MHLLLMFLTSFHLQAQPASKCDRGTINGLAQDLVFASCVSSLRADCLPQTTVLDGSLAIKIGGGVTLATAGAQSVQNFAAAHEAGQEIFSAALRGDAGVEFMLLERGIEFPADPAKMKLAQQLLKSSVNFTAREVAAGALAALDLPLAVGLGVVYSDNEDCTESAIGPYVTMDIETQGCNTKLAVSRQVENFLKLPDREQDKLLHSFPEICTFYAELSKQWINKNDIGSLKNITCDGAKAKSYRAEMKGHEYEVELQSTVIQFRSVGGPQVEFTLSSSTKPTLRTTNYTPLNGPARTLNAKELDHAPASDAELILTMFKEWNVAHAVADNCCKNPSLPGCNKLVTKTGPTEETDVEDVM